MSMHYWRKHPDLHGWMEKLCRAKGGKFDDFNLAPVAYFVLSSSSGLAKRQMLLRRELDCRADLLEVDATALNIHWFA
jgi:hypothetical protein